MHPFAFGVAPYGAYQSPEQVRQYQRRALEHEIHAIEERQRLAQRKHRRDLILKQAQQLQALLNQVQNGGVAISTSDAPPPPKTLTPITCEQQTTPVEWMLIKLAQQNEELHTLIKSHNGNASPRLDDSFPATRSEAANANMKNCSTRPPTTSHPRTDDGTKSREPDPDSIAEAQQEVSPQTIHPSTPAFCPWAAAEDLPEIDWTDNDEELLEQLLREKDAASHGLLNPSGDTSGSTGDTTNSNATTALKRNQQQDRQESRRKLAQLYDTSSITNSSEIRRPRWRIEQDIANGVVRPFAENGEGATTEQPMPARQLFRAAVVAVLAVVKLQRLLNETRLQLRDKSIQDLEPMLNVYFDATRVWLGKLVKVPLLSIVQDPALDLDVSTKSGLFRAPKGLSKWFGKKRSPSATPPPPQGSTTSADQSRTVKLKVRVKGIVDAIAKAIDKGVIPNGILEFWKRVTSDGVYFPSTYPLFALERQALDLDALGATRNMRHDCTTLPGQSYSRFGIVLANFMLLRLLIPHVVLRPWESGIGAAANAPRAVATNLKNVATLLYAIVSRLSPVPPVSTDPDQSTRGGVRRRSVEVVPVTGPLEAPDTHSNNQAQDASTEAPRFLTIADIHRLLIPDKHFPLSQLEPFVCEQHVRLRTALQVLHTRLHPQANESEDLSNVRQVNE